MHSLATVLAEHPFLKDLAPQHLELITGCSKNVRFDAGDFLCRHGENANEFWIIRQGRVSVETFSPTVGPITIQTVEEGDILGWGWLVPPYQWHFDARAIEMTRAISLDGTCLRNKCEADHDLGYELLKRFADIMARRLDATRLQILDVYGEGVAVKHRRR